MRKEKGFTLVELMGILVILGVLLLVTVPTITKTLKKSKTNEEAEYKTTVCAAAKTYLSIEKASYNTFWTKNTGANVSETINISLLKDEGYLADNLNNPTTFNKIKVIRYISTEKNMECDLVN